MPRFRFTVRRMMVAVAIAAVVAGFLAGRRSRFLRIAAEHEKAARSLMLHEGFFIPPRYFDETAMATKYLRAARHPWLPIASDPPDLPAFGQSGPSGDGAFPDLPPGGPGLIDDGGQVDQKGRRS